MSEETAKAERYAAILERHITDAIERALQGLPVRLANGGDLELKLELGDLTNVKDGGRTDGDTIIWTDSSGYYEPGAGGGPGGGGSHGAHFSLPIPAMIVPPGPKNLSGGDWTITAVNYVSDGEITTATILGAGTVSVAAGGNGDGVDVTGLNITVADGERLTITGVTYPDPTDANYLAVTWCIESAA